MDNTDVTEVDAVGLKWVETKLVMILCRKAAKRKQKRKSRRGNNNGVIPLIRTLLRGGGVIIKYYGAGKEKMFGRKILDRLLF